MVSASGPGAPGHGRPLMPAPRVIERDPLGVADKRVVEPLELKGAR